MNPQSKCVVWGIRGIVLLVALALIGLWGKSLKEDRIRSFIISCTNHGNHVRMGMLIPAHDNPDWELPFIRGEAGYRVLYAYTLEQGGTLNCHHGAPRVLKGGWQYVNLAPEIWNKVFARWESLYPTEHGLGVGIPLHWCGRGTGTLTRYVTTVLRPDGAHLGFYPSRMREEELRVLLQALNRLLVELGEAPVQLDISANIDWTDVNLWASNAVALLPSRPLDRDGIIEPTVFRK